MALLILVVAVIVVGVVIAVRTGPSTGRSPTLGLWGLACGLAAVFGVAMIGQATFGWVPSFDPPEWLRIVTFWMLPVGVVPSVILGTLSLKRASRRTPAIAGLVLAVLSAVAFIGMVASIDY